MMNLRFKKLFADINSLAVLLAKELVIDWVKRPVTLFLLFWNAFYHSVEAHVHRLWSVGNTSGGLGDQVDSAFHWLAYKPEHSFAEANSASLQAALFSSLQWLDDDASNRAKHFRK